MTFDLCRGQGSYHFLKKKIIDKKVLELYETCRSVKNFFQPYVKKLKNFSCAPFGLVQPILSPPKPDSNSANNFPTFTSSTIITWAWSLEPRTGTWIKYKAQIICLTLSYSAWPLLLLRQSATHSSRLFLFPFIHFPLLFVHKRVILREQELDTRPSLSLIIPA